MGRFQMIANILFEPGHALRRRARPQIRFAIPPMPVQAEAVAKELELFPPRVLGPGLALFKVGPSRVITRRVQSSASAALPRLKMTKSSAYETIRARKRRGRSVFSQYLRKRFM